VSGENKSFQRNSLYGNDLRRDFTCADLTIARPQPMLYIVKGRNTQHNGSEKMNITTTLTVLLIGFILLGSAGSAVYSAAKDCADRINERNNATISAMYGN